MEIGIQSDTWILAFARMGIKIMEQAIHKKGLYLLITEN